MVAFLTNNTCSNKPMNPGFLTGRPYSNPHSANNSLIESANVRMFMTLMEIWSEKVHIPRRTAERSILIELELMCDQFYTFSHTISEVSKEILIHEALKENERTKVTVRCVNGEWLPESVSCQPVAIKTIVGENLFIVNGFLTPVAQVDQLAASTLVDHFVEYCGEGKNVEVLATRIQFSCQRDFKLLKDNSKVEYEGIPQVFIGGSWESICVRSEGAAIRICGHLGLGGYTVSLIRSYSRSVSYSAERHSHDYKLVKTDDKFPCRYSLQCRATCKEIWLHNVNVVCTGSKEFPLEGEWCSLRCNDGYVRAGPGLVQCMANGWSADTSFVFCERKETKELSIYYGNQETVSCNKVGQTVEILYASYYAACTGTEDRIFIPFYGWVYGGMLIDCDNLGFCDRGNSYTDMSTTELQGICSGKKSCVLKAGDDWDLCPEVDMYLDVQWSCTN